MIIIGHKRLMIVKTVAKDATGKRTLIPKMENGEPVTRQVANEPVRVTRAKLNGHFCRDSGRRLVVKLKDGDVLELRPQGCKKGVYSATLFDIYAWMIRTSADHAKMTKLRDLKARKAGARRSRALRRPVEQGCGS